MKTLFYAAAAAAMLAFGATAAEASTVYTFTQDGCSGTCGTGPFGTVTVSDDLTDIGSVDITIALASGVFFHENPDANHHALAFDLNGNPAVTLKNLTANDTTNLLADVSLNGPGSFSSPSFGTFGYALNIAKSHTTPFPKDVTTISFELFNPTNSPLVFDATGLIYFTTDVVGTNGNTGNVGALAGTTVTTEGGGSPTPEPATWIAMIAGFGLLGSLLRRRSGILELVAG